jgi:hypothetical protein
MPNFDPLFSETNVRPIIYKGNSLIRVDKFPVKNGDVLIASIEKADTSKRRQGFFVDITGYCEMDGEIHKKGKGIMMLFWQDTMPKQVEIKVFTKQDFVWIQNIWEYDYSYSIGSPSGEIIEKVLKGTDYSVNGAAMIVEEIENGRRYRCNDGEPDEDFDDIIFTVQKA